MRHPRRFLALSGLLSFPTIIVTSLAEDRLELSAGATFGLLMVLSLVTIFVALWLADEFAVGPDPRDREDR
jgi:hypothetical protein